MAELARFYGLIIKMFFRQSELNQPHIHAEYAGMEAVVSIPSGEVIESDDGFPAKKLRMVQTWIDIHEEELMADWNLALNHGEVFKIRGLDEK